MLDSSYQASPELHALVARLCDEDLGAAGQSRLETLLAGDRDAQAWYLRYVDLHAAVRMKVKAVDDEDFALSEVQAALGAPVGKESDSLDDHMGAVTASVHSGWFSLWDRLPRGGAWAATVALIGLGWATIAVLGQRPPADAQTSSAMLDASDEVAAVAKLSGAVGARWAGDVLELPEGQVFSAQQRLELIEGLAEITFRCGARVIVQGPAVLEGVEGDSVKVSVGRVAVSTAPEREMFTIHTAASQLSAREAEFGADIEFDGTVVTEVYRGNVELRFARSREPETTFQLAGGQGARIDAKSHSVTPLSQPYDLHFVRYLPQHELLVNLADVVAGGNGLRKAYHRGVSVADGHPVDEYGAPAQGNGKYLRTSSVPFVDGVFIPNGKLGPVQVDSIGRKFADFPPTAGDCWGGAIMARRPREEKSLPFIRLEFHGDNYGYVNWLHIASEAENLSPQGYGLIGMHSNCGITFDLHALRAKYPNKRAIGFRALVGNLESKPDPFVADAWVIVDGELRYRREAFSREDGPDAIDIPLSDRDRFLVLAVTDSGRNTAYDWVAFGDPLVELAGSGETSAAADSAMEPRTATASSSPAVAFSSSGRRRPVASNLGTTLAGLAPH